MSRVSFLEGTSEDARARVGKAFRFLRAAMLNFFYKVAWYAWCLALALHLCGLFGWIVPQAVSATIGIMMGVTMIIMVAGMFHIRQFSDALMEGDEGGDGFPVRNMFKGVPSWTVWLTLVGFFYPLLVVLLPSGLPEGQVFDHGNFYTLAMEHGEVVPIGEEEYRMHRARQLVGFSSGWIAFLGFAIWMFYPERVMQRNRTTGLN